MTSRASVDLVFALACEEPCQFLEWEDSYCVYAPRTGQTHLLNEFPALTLRLITKRPRTIGSVSKILSRLMPDLTEQEIEVSLSEVLRQLRQLGLVRNMTSCP
jgi:PqqD family protein of HPr-rel-A system